MTIGQGQSGLLTVTVKSLERDQPVNLTAINLPEGVTVQFNPSSPTGGESRTINATTYVSYNAPVGNHTVTILANSWLQSYVCIQLVITPARTETRPAGLFAPILVVPLICAGVAIIVLVAIAVLLRSRGRRN